MTSSYAGTRDLIRLILRRDRVRLPVWLVGLGGMIAVSALAVPPIYDTPEKVAGYARAIGTSPVSYLMSGRQAAVDTIGGIVANEISQVAQLGICLMVMFLVVRHTRAEEETGRAELLRSSVVGRHAATLAGAAVRRGRGAAHRPRHHRVDARGGPRRHGQRRLRRRAGPARPLLRRRRPRRRAGLDVRPRSPRPRRRGGRGRLPRARRRRHAGQRARLGLALRVGPADGCLRRGAVVAGGAAGGADGRPARAGCVAHRAPRLRRRGAAARPGRARARASSARRSD